MSENLLIERKHALGFYVFYVCILQINSCQKGLCLGKHVLDEEDKPQHSHQKDKELSQEKD